MMERPFAPLLLVAVLTACVSGCNRTSSGEYRTIRETTAPAPQTVEIAAAGPAEKSETTITAKKPSPDVVPTADSSPGSSSTTPTTANSPTPAVPPGDDQGGIPAPASGDPRTIELKVAEKTFAKEGTSGSLRISFDDLDLLKVLNMEPVPIDATRHFPHWLNGLDGQQVRLRGWMFPPPQTEDLPQFLFVRDNQICCFGRKAKVYDKVAVQLKDGVTTNYIQGRPFDVEGRFRIQPEEIDGELFLLYYLEEAVLTGS